MIDFLAQLIAWINIPVNALCGILFAPAGHLPGWAFNTIFAFFLAVVGIIVFKYTSNQDAIGKVSDKIRADMIGLILFKDSVKVTLQLQSRLFKSSFMLFFHAIKPLAVMIIPVALLILQLGLWYQVRPLMPGERALVKMELNGAAGSELPEVSIASMPQAEIIIDKTTVASKRHLYWEIEAKEFSSASIVFQVDGSEYEKQLTVGDGFIPVSQSRPGWDFLGILENPREKPFAIDSPVKSISIEYPDRESLISGSDSWLIYIFVASLVFGMILMPVFKVKVV
jgi:hypothetical protein